MTTIALAEYCLQVPANRWGYGQFTAAQLKIAQEVITLLVFIGFAWRPLLAVAVVSLH